MLGWTARGIDPAEYDIEAKPRLFKTLGNLCNTHPALML